MNYQGRLNHWMKTAAVVCHPIPRRFVRLQASRIDCGSLVLIGRIRIDGSSPRARHLRSRQRAEAMQYELERK